MDFTDFIAQMLSEILLLLQICKGYTHETRLKIAYKLMIMIGYAVARQKSAFYAWAVILQCCVISFHSSQRKWICSGPHSRPVLELSPPNLVNPSILKLLVTTEMIKTRSSTTMVGELDLAVIVCNPPSGGFFRREMNDPDSNFPSNAKLDFSQKAVIWEYRWDLGSRD